MSLPAFQTKDTPPTISTSLNSLQTRHLDLDIEIGSLKEESAILELQLAQMYYQKVSAKTLLARLLKEKDLALEEYNMLSAKVQEA